MPALKIAVVNEGQLPAEDVEAFAAAAEKWVGERLKEYWPDVDGTTIRAVADGSKPAADEAWIVLAPTTTLANSLGYHEWTTAGLPLGIVELDACRQAQIPWTIPGTHEIGELLINPRLDQYVAVLDFWYPREICDPVTSDRFEIDTVAVANAVTPAWFDKAAPGASQFDLLGNVHAPIPDIPKGGWVEWWDGQAWQNRWGAETAPEMQAYMRGRQGRRYIMRRGREAWRNSEGRVGS